MCSGYRCSALWVMQSTTGPRPIDCINKSGLIKVSEVFWLILQSQIVIRLDSTGFNPVLLCYTWFKYYNTLLTTWNGLNPTISFVTLRYMYSINLVADIQPMSFMVKWQPLMYLTLARLRIGFQSRFHQVEHVAMLYP